METSNRYWTNHLKNRHHFYDMHLSLPALHGFFFAGLAFFLWFFYPESSLTNYRRWKPASPSHRQQPRVPPTPHLPTPAPLPGKFANRRPPNHPPQQQKTLLLRHPLLHPQSQPQLHKVTWLRLTQQPPQSALRSPSHQQAYRLSCNRSPLPPIQATWRPFL